jgi:hypothetical protein
MILHPIPAGDVLYKHNGGGLLPATGMMERNIGSPLVAGGADAILSPSSRPIRYRLITLGECGHV